MVQPSKTKLKKINASFRVATVVAVILFLLFAIITMLRWHPERFDNGALDLTQEDINPEKLVPLSGMWEFYYGKHLYSEDFEAEKIGVKRDYIKVPGSWDVNTQGYSNQGVATYRMVVHYPQSIKDPALRVTGVSVAYRLFVNGQLLATVGAVDSEEAAGAEVVIVNLPTEPQTLEIIVQVSNPKFAKGGIRESPVFGSRKVLDQMRNVHMAFQLIFIGSVLIFAIHYLLLFILQRSDYTSLVFSLICLVTGVRSLIWGEIPLFIFSPEVSYNTLGYINYVTGYNIIPLMLIFVALIYPQDYKKKSLTVVLVPTLFFDALLFTSLAFMSNFTKYLYLLMIVQMTYMLIILIRAVLNQRENALLMFISISLYILMINQDILHYSGLGGINVNIMFLYGNITVIIALSYIQARQHAIKHQKLILYNETLIEANRLKDKIMETEMSFLQAQIKPHFLYNALNAIANISEKNGEEGSKRILDLAGYLRESLAFNNLEKRVSLEKELEFVDQYFNIEQARFGDKIKLAKNVNCPLNFQIPVLILQPLVENAVRHGITKKIEGGSVVLNIDQTETETIFEIVDDGVGIKPEILAELLTDDLSKQSIGLININSRLQRIYGCSLVITSEVDIGTRVKFILLKSKDNDFGMVNSENERGPY